MSVAGSALTGRRQCDPHTLKAMAAGLKQAVAADAPVVRDVPSKKLGDIVVEERDDRVYAQMDIGPVLLRAAGADISKTGCGGPIWNPTTRAARWKSAEPLPLHLTLYEDSRIELVV